MPEPEPSPGEVRVRVALSGVNPGDTKKRSDWLGYGMQFPRIVPHSDGSGVIDAVGDGVAPGRIGQRVWLHGAQSYRPFGTAAQLTVVPTEQAVELPAEVSDETGTCLGIPGITTDGLGVFEEFVDCPLVVRVLSILDRSEPTVGGNQEIGRQPEG